MDNDTLLISEVIDKVILPYTEEEINNIINENEDYKNSNEVIEKFFTKPLSEYKFQAWARYNETMNLAKTSEQCSYVEALALSLEMMKKRYLHPSIIAACRNLDELYVYLDCLEKDELEEFKIFNIKYELHPVAIKNKGEFIIKENIFERFVNMIKSIFRKKEL